MTATSAAIRSSDTSSTAITDRAVNLIPRDASSQITIHDTSAIGNQSALAAMPVCRMNARVNTAMPSTETGGKTMYVPISAQLAKKPARGPSVLPTNA